MLLADVIVVFLPRMIEKFALKFGSSQQGKALRASGASIWVTASHLLTYDLLKFKSDLKNNEQLKAFY